MTESKNQVKTGFNWHSLKNRVTFSYICINAVIFLVAVWTSRQLYSLTKDNSQLVESMERSQDYLHELSYKVQQTNQLLQNELILPGVDYENNRNKTWEGKIIPLLDSLEHYKKIWSTHEIRSKYEILRLSLNRLQKSQAEIADLLKEEQAQSYFETEKSPEDIKFSAEINSRNSFKNKFLDAVNVVDKHFTELQKLQTNYFDTQERSNNQNLSLFWLLAFFVLLIALVLINATGYLLAQRMNTRLTTLLKQSQSFKRGYIPKDMPLFRDETGEVMRDLEGLGENLERLKTFAYQVKEGDFAQNIAIFEPESEMGKALNEMHDGLQHIAERDRQRNWTNEGIALFSNLLREYNDAQDLYDDLISSLVKYLMANQGGIFVLNDTNPYDPVMELKSVYAYDRKRFTEKTIHPGQSLVGQAWREKDTIYIEQVTQNYVQIASGLGGGNPRSVLIIPMINNESVVLGAMELASFKTFQPYEIDFVKRVGEMIVSAISSLKNSEKTQILLADAQRASERLRLQEEATRHQVQILQHQQEELSHAKALLKEQAASVELASCVLELDMNAMILQANDILLQILGYAPEDLVGESYGKLIGEREINSAEYYHFWQNVTEGVNQNLELRFFTKQGADVWFLASFVAVRNAEHQLYKILALMSEITTQKRTQIQLKAKLESLYLSLPVIEFTQHGIIMDANELYLRLTEYTLDELKGKPHRLVLSWNEQNTPEYQDFWFKLGEGEAKTGTFCHIAHSGREVWFKGTYQPMHDDAGNVFRVVLWAQEITQEKIHQQQNEPVSFEI